MIGEDAKLRRAARIHTFRDYHLLFDEQAKDADYVSSRDMLAKLREDKGWVDEAEKRAWFLFEATRQGDEPGR